MTKKSKGVVNHLVNTLGPGLLFSGAAIGVSHLVMSTRAGATYGLIMLVFVVVANLLKYPFFQFGPVYAACTGKDLLDGYNSIGRSALILFTLFTALTFFIFIAAVTIVTAGLAIVLLDLKISAWLCSFYILIMCASILVLGHYHYLVKIIKVIIVVLTLATIVAFITSLYAKYNIGFERAVEFTRPSLWTESSISFLIALMGWMPAPVELSVWHSIWQLEKKKDDPSAGSISGALMDFNVGYFGTAIIAVLFVCLGTFMVYGTGEEFPNHSVGFAQKIIQMYTDVLGIWSWWVIALASCTTMFSTTLTLLDAYARVMAKSFALLFYEKKICGYKLLNNDSNYNLWLVISVLGAIYVLGFFLDNMKSLTTFATILSFLTAPVFAYLNFKVITDSHVQGSYKISRFMRVLSYIGLLFLLTVSLFYIIFILVF